jgi:hypothetical protein
MSKIRNRRFFSTTQKHAEFRNNNLIEVKTLKGNKRKTESEMWIEQKIDYSTFRNRVCHENKVKQ